MTDNCLVIAICGVVAFLVATGVGVFIGRWLVIHQVRSMILDADRIKEKFKAPSTNGDKRVESEGKDG